MQRPVYNKAIVEFITVSNEYCSMIENVKEIKREDMLLRASLILPLLYLKTSLLPKLTYQCDETVDIFVDEPLYYVILKALLSIMEHQDDYLVFREEDAQVTETVQGASIAEDLTDIYQSLKNCLMIYQLGTEDVMNDAILECNEQFKEYWGIRLLNGLKAIHCLRNECQK